MLRVLFTLFLFGFAGLSRAADSKEPLLDSELVDTLGFEAEHEGAMPEGWVGGPAETISPDAVVVHTGKWAVRLARKQDSPQKFSQISMALPVDFKGTQVELRGFLRTEAVDGFAGLWMREDGVTPSLAFDNMQKRQLKGTTGWQEYAISLPVHADAKKLFVGILIVGTGTVWADDLQLLVDGKPVRQAPKAERILTVIDRDHEFDAGSKIDLPALSPAQIGNLAALAKVWGFLKYHHPKVTSGQIHWDYELFRVMPSVLTATDRAAANTVLVRWIEGLGEVPLAQSPPSLGENELHLRPELDWIEDVGLLGSDLSSALRRIRDRRSATGRQFYVSLEPGVGNPIFTHENDYVHLKLPDAGYRLLGLFRFWNIIRYWFPYRDLIEEDWDKVLTEYIPRTGPNRSFNNYQLEMMSLISKVHDTHANLWSSLHVRPPIGNSQLPVIVRFIEGQAVVAGLQDEARLVPAPLRIGDVLLEIDGESVAELVKKWSPYYAASNEPTRLRDIARNMTRGPDGPVKVRVQRGAESLELVLDRPAGSALAGSNNRWQDLPGATFRLLSKDVAYLKLSSVKSADVTSYIRQAAGTKALIIDVRNYPSEFVVFSLGTHLVEKPTEFVRFTNPDLANPGAFHFTAPITLLPAEPRYQGKVIVLVDEVTQSQGEYTAMALRVAPGAKVIGSTTAGADGNVSKIPLPGGLRAMVSGIGVFYPDKHPTQQVGIIPDTIVCPTLDGIREGRDEVMEEALRQVLGSEISSEEIKRLATVTE